jgi:hypothetical protein
MTTPMQSRASRPQPRRFPGWVVTLGLVTFIGIAAIGAWWIHLTNIRARASARAAVERDAAAEREATTDPVNPEPGRPSEGMPSVVDHEVPSAQ